MKKTTSVSNCLKWRENWTETFFLIVDEIKSMPNFPNIWKGNFVKNEKTNSYESQEDDLKGRRPYKKKTFQEEIKKALQEEDIRGI